MVISTIHLQPQHLSSKQNGAIRKCGAMKIYNVVTTCFTISVGFFVLFLTYVHLTVPNVQLHAYAPNQPAQLTSDYDDDERIPSHFLKNMNASIKRMGYDREYALSNISANRKNVDGDALLVEDDEDDNPLFIDVMKISRFALGKKNLPVATDKHDLSGYVSILHPNESHIELQCTTCSLVSSSGHLLRSKAGQAIDSADCVFRMNDAPSRGFSKDVGSRTSLRMIGFQAVPNILKNKDVLLLGSAKPRYVAMWGPKRELTSNGTGKGYNHLRALAMMLERLGVGCFMLSAEEMEYNDRLYESIIGLGRSNSGSWLTTGWFTMIMARSVCSEIHVYGMVGENYCKHDHGRKYPYHYYEARSQDECEYYRSMEKSYHGGHRFMTEKAIFASWAKLTPKIYFHQPEWN